MKFRNRSSVVFGVVIVLALLWLSRNSLSPSENPSIRNAASTPAVDLVERPTGLVRVAKDQDQAIWFIDADTVAVTKTGTRTGDILVNKFGQSVPEHHQFEVTCREMSYSTDGKLAAAVPSSPEWLVIERMCKKDFWGNFDRD